MKKYIIQFILSGYLFLSFFLTQAQSDKETAMLRAILEKNHYSPKPIDDQLSKEVFKRFLNVLDPNSLYFTEAELKSLTGFEFSIDDEIKGKSWKFLPFITELYKQRLLIAEKTFTSILEKPFDFTSNETLSFSESDSLNFAKDEKEYLQRWNKWLKYKTLRQLIGLYSDSTATDKSVLMKEPQMRQKVKMVQKRSIKRMLEHPHGFENYVASLFFNAITYYFDPHSVYMSKTDWENFDAQLSTESLSYGMDLDENDAGDIIIARLVPGGPAWKSNEIHKGDILTELKWAGKDAVDLTGAEVHEVEAMLEASNSELLEITVKMASGMLKTVSLKKEKIRDEDNIVKSYILNGEKKIGYISLPGFYSEWENMSPLGCSNDVAKEIVKLKQENIDGIILDIRYNGGGSLIEGLNLAGIFINEGPLFMMQASDRKPYVMKDMNRGTVYDGPLALMVNGLSASASEVLASTLQDYNRAVIVGSPTYGKATGQIVIPLDTTINPLQLTELKSPYGVATVTVKKLYRITGKSAQLKGVQPDVHLPDIYESMDYKESSYPYALPSDSVTKKVIYYPLSPLPIKSLSEKSFLRVGKDKDFMLMKKIIDSQTRLRKDMNTVSLNFSVLKNKILDSYKQWQLLEQRVDSDTVAFSVINTHSDQEVMNLDSYSKEINEVLIENIHEDFYIEETFQILSDLINLTKK